MPAWARLLLLLAAALPAAAGAQITDLVSRSSLRVCEDPANWPMSNEAGEGFENRIAALLAETLGLPLEYTWYPMATGFVRRTLGENRCDLIVGYAQGHELVQNTNHYYTSAFALVVPGTGPLAAVETLSDPALKAARIGVVAGTPPADHMARNGLIAAARPYRLMVDRRFESPIPDMLADLAAGEIDAAIAWGPIAGPLVKAEYPGFRVVPLIREELPPRLVYRITMGVRQGERVWERELNALIRRHQAEIDAILRDAGVPLLDDMGTALKDAG